MEAGLLEDGRSIRLVKSVNRVNQDTWRGRRLLELREYGMRVMSHIGACAKGDGGGLRDLV